MRAIILAAGMGTRLRPLTKDRPKALVRVEGEPIIERQIKFLQEAGIGEIFVVTGYLAQEFDYLAQKYGVRLIYNDKYNVYNNCYSMYLVREYLGKTYVLEGDVFLLDNFLQTNLEYSTYFAGLKEDFKGEWIVKFDKENYITDISIASGTDYIMSGISYWTPEDGKRIRKMLEGVVQARDFEDLFWDDLIKDSLEEFNLKIHKIKGNQWVEIDTVEDLEEAESLLSYRKTRNR